MSQETEQRRLKFLFESNAMTCNTVLNQDDFKLNDEGRYINENTEFLFDLWLMGHSQGIIDQAAQQGDVQL